MLLLNSNLILTQYVLMCKIIYIYDASLSPIIVNHLIVCTPAGSSYRFRITAVYSNHETRSSPNSAKIVLIAGHPSKSTIPSPIIVEARPLSISEIFIGWQVLRFFPSKFFIINLFQFIRLNNCKNDVNLVG